MNMLTIAEFAEKVGVTPQAIYKRIKTDLAPYIVVENGVKLLKEEALELFNHSLNIKASNREKELLERIQELESLVESLKEDKLELLAKSQENSDKLWLLTEKLTQLQENSQVLLAQTNQVVLSLNKPTETEVEEPTIVEEVDNNLHKPSLFKRIFKRP